MSKDKAQPGNPLAAKAAEAAAQAVENPNAGAEKFQALVKQMPKRAVQLSPHRLGLAEHKRNVHFATVPPKTTKEQLLDPLFWGHVTDVLRAGGRIEVVPEDAEYFAELHVVSVSKHAAAVALLRFVELQVAPLAGMDDLGDYNIEHAGATSKWRAVRRADGRTIVDGQDSLDAVVDYLRSNGYARAA